MKSNSSLQQHASSGPEYLNTLATTTITNEECINFNNLLTDNVICTMNPRNQGVCFGDEGGPLVVDNFIVGVVMMVYNCGVGFPDFHARVSSHHSWILSHVQ